MGNELTDCIQEIQRAYYSTVYSATKAILAPVVGALSDAITETVSNSVREGISQALDPVNFQKELKNMFGSFFKKTRTDNNG